MRSVRALASLLCVLLLAPLTLRSQRPGVIQGRVEVRDAAAPARRPDPSALGMPAERDAPDVRQAVVYLESAPSLAFPDADPPRARMDQRNETFVPHVLAVTVGTTVDFPNSDRTYHNVFSLSGARRFDLGRYAAGRSRAVRFDRPGIVRVFCEIHSHMSAYILVFNHPFFAVTRADGRYRIDRVPPGRYTLVAWNRGSIRDSRRVVVPEDGGSVEADFSLP